MTELMPGIKQISQVGNDMYIQGAFPVGIVNTDVSYLADPADTHLLASRDPVISEISVGMTGNEIKEEYITGTPPLTLDDSEGYPLQWWQVTLSPYQEGTGDPAPDNVRPIHGTDKVTIWTAGNSVITLPETIYSGQVYAGGAVSGVKMINAKDINWNYSQGTVYCTPADLYKTVSSDAPTGRKPMWCNIAKYTANSNTAIGEIGYGGMNNNGNIIFNNPSIAPDLATWRQYIADNDVLIYYPLVTPTTLTLTTPTIPTPKGNATAWATAEDGVVDNMEVTYVGKA